MGGRRERLHKLNLLSLFGWLLLEEVLQVVVSLLMLGLGDVDRIDQHLRVVHGAPTNQTTVVAECRELMFLDVAVDCLLDIEVSVRHS